MRVYLGAAAGVGTTYAMLDEGARRAARGTDVVVGWVDTHRRPRTVEKLGSLMDVERAPASLDVIEIIRRRPAVVLVDELHRVTDEAVGQAPNWKLVDQILDAGIHVIATLTVQHIESLADTVAGIVGRPPDGLVPDSFLLRAEQIELVDMTPEAIRRRIAHGNVFGSEALDPGDSELFNTDAFAHLRALLVIWMAERLQANEEARGHAEEKVVVAVTDAPSSPTVVRRAARLAQRLHAPLLGVHVVASTQAEANPHERRRQVESVGGAYYEVSGERLARALVSFAEAEHATQLVVGNAHSARWRRRGSVVRSVLEQNPRLDLHVVTAEDAPNETRPAPWRGGVSRRRQLLGFALGAVVLAVLTATLVANRGELSVATSLALYLLAVVAITAVGGQWPGIAAALAGPLIANWYLIPPYHTFRINNAENLLELLVFLSVAIIVSFFVSIATRRASEADRAWREASTLALLSESGAAEPLQGIVELLRTTFRFAGVAVLEGTGENCRVLASTGPDSPVSAAGADLVMSIGPDATLVASGGPLPADDHRVLKAFLAQLAKALEQHRLREIESAAQALEQADQLRTAMLRSVSHDLRTPLSSIKASVSSLRQSDVRWNDAERNEFLESIESETDRLTSIVTNLLDLSRLEAGVLSPRLRPVSLEEVIPGALHALGDRAATVHLELPADIEEVEVDPALLERAVANLVENAVKWSPPGRSVIVRAHCTGPDAQIHIIDHGPGIPADQRDVVVQPFHRLGDGTNAGGLGLGLAIADRVIAAMGGRLELRDTPGGGLTAVISLPSRVWSAR